MIKMNKKTIIYIIIGILLSGTVFLTGYTKYKNPDELYRVYLSGKTIGYIKSKDELEKYIDLKESEIKKEYNVKNVYTPKDLDVVKEVTYNKKISTVEDIYQKIKDISPFTISGYTITIKGVEEIDEDGKHMTDDVVINVLDKNIFNEAIMTTLKVFIPEDKYEAYVNKEQSKITDTGRIIENVYIQNEMTIKKNKISVDDRIFTDSDLLSKYLLFGTLDEQKTYKVKAGDTIEQVAYNNKLSVEEFLIANTEFNSSDNLLYPGQVVCLGAARPAFKLIEEDHVVEDEVDKYKTEVVYDDNMMVGVERVKQEGHNGKNRVTKKIKKANGEVVSAVVVESNEIEPTVNKIVARGKGTISVGSVGAGGWAWPTKTPYQITSNYGWRWGKIHKGLDISGTGYGSPIYAANDGVVTEAASKHTNGIYIIINHNNGYYTEYAHMSALLVKKGDIVTIGQQIGRMGHSGFATGTHLHFGVWRGVPYLRASSAINPMSLYR